MLYTHVSRYDGNMSRTCAIVSSSPVALLYFSDSAIEHSMLAYMSPETVGAGARCEMQAAYGKMILLSALMLINMISSKT
eukprot:6212788-Pleurochrysis_carterae.AAC.3